MTSRDIQLELQEHLNNATLATDTEKLVTHLAAFTRDWKLEPSLDQLDSALQLLSETRQGINFEVVALWWLGYIQDIALSNTIPRHSPALGQGTEHTHSKKSNKTRKQQHHSRRRTLTNAPYPIAMIQLCSDPPIHSPTCCRAPQHHWSSVLSRCARPSTLPSMRSGTYMEENRSSRDSAR